MNKAKLLKWVNLVLFICAAIQVTTGLMMALRLFTKQMEFIGELHEYNGFIFSAIVLTHLTLNWNWVKVTFFKRQITNS